MTGLVSLQKDQSVQEECRRRMERRGRLEVFRLLLLCCLPAAPLLAQVRHPVPVLWMVPVGSGSGRENRTATVSPAVRLALQDLQRQPPPLGSYDIQLQLLETQVLKLVEV